MLFRKRLKQLRQARGWTQKELGDRLHLGGTAISNYEVGSNQPALQTLVNMANVFDVSVDYLLGAGKDGKSPVENSFRRLSPRRQKEIMALMECYYELDESRRQARRAAAAAKKAAEKEKTVDEST